MMDIVSVHGLPFLVCLGMLAILGYIGIHVLKREVIFIDMALAGVGGGLAWRWAETKGFLKY